MNARFKLASSAALLLGVTLLMSYAFANRNHSDDSISSSTIASVNEKIMLEKEHHDSARLSAELNNIIKKLDLRVSDYPQDYESSLIKVLLFIKAGHTERAMQALDELISVAPDFHLAHLVKGDLFSMRVRSVSGIGKSPVLSKFAANKSEELTNLQHEALARIKSFIEQVESEKIPRQLLGLSLNTTQAILVDKSRHRLYVYERKSDALPPVLIHDFYVSTGKVKGNKFVRGDLRTPEGVYFVTSWLPDSKLPDKYGIGAFPVDYPNALDNKLGKTGYGIWLHGTDRDNYSRPPLDSEGCVVLPNIDLDKIKKYIKPGETPIIIANEIDWLDYADWTNERNSVLVALEAWRKDWESLNVDKYLSHYAEDFWSGAYNLRSWQQRKRAVARSKTYQNVKLTDVSLFAYPYKYNKKDNIYVVRFRQHYKSNNYKGDIYKRIYLVKRSETLKILYEGS